MDFLIPPKICSFSTTTFQPPRRKSQFPLLISQLTPIRQLVLSLPSNQNVKPNVLSSHFHHYTPLCPFQLPGPLHPLQLPSASALDSFPPNFYFLHSTAQLSPNLHSFHSTGSFISALKHTIFKRLNS